MEVFTQFSSDVDATTLSQLHYGQGLMRMLRQPQFSPMPQYRQVITLVAALAHIMQNIPVDKVGEFIDGLNGFFESDYPDICSSIDRDGQLSDDVKNKIISAAERFRDEMFSERK